MLSIHPPQSASDVDLVSRPLLESLGINHISTQSCLRLRQRGLQDLFQGRQLQGWLLPELMFDKFCTSCWFVLEDKRHQEKLMLIQKIGPTLGLNLLKVLIHSGLGHDFGLGLRGLDYNTADCC